MISKDNLLTYFQAKLLAKKAKKMAVNPFVVVAQPAVSNLLEVKYDFSGSRSEADKTNIIKKSLREAVEKYSPINPNEPITLLIATDSSRNNPNNRLVLAETLFCLSDLTKESNSFNQKFHLDLRALGNMAVAADLYTLRDLMQNSNIIEVKLAGLSCKEKPSEFTYNTEQDGAIRLAINSSVRSSLKAKTN